MNETAQVQAAISFLPYRLSHVGEGDAFFHIIRQCNDDLENVHHFIEETTKRIDSFYHDEYVPHGCKQKK